MTKAFALLDQNLSLIEIDPTVGCIAFWRRVDDESDMPEGGAEIGEYLQDEIRVPAAALASYSDYELARYRIHSATFPSAPEGQRLESYSLEMVSGVLVIYPVWAPV